MSAYLPIRARLTIVKAIVLVSLIAAFFPMPATPASAASTIIVSEVAPWSSGNSPTDLRVDWFELTNTGASAVNITGWKVDDDSHNFMNAIALAGIISIGPGESVIFLEASAGDLPGKAAAFRNIWFGNSPPAGLQIGNYTGSGIGLGTGGDEVNIYDGAGVLQTMVKFGASSSAAPFRTFDNAAGINGTITTLSAVAPATNDTTEIGSPGTIGTPLQPPPTPLPTVRINEIESSGGSPDDWIELVNTGSSTADLSGLKLKDSVAANPFYTIPAGTSLAAGAFLVIERAQLPWGLDDADSVTLFAFNETTVIDTYSWTVPASTTYGRCPDGSTSYFGTMLAATKGAANACITAENWPGGATVTTVDNLGTFATNLSGLTYQASGTTAPGVIWAVVNDPSTLFRLIWDAPSQKWIPDPNGWATGKALRYTDGTGNPDSEGLTFTDAGIAGGLYVSTERNNSNSGVSRPSVLRFDISGSGSVLTATHEWNLTSDLPPLGANLGLEAIAWIPDSFLVARSFYDEGKGHTYNPAEYPLHGSGLFFVGVEANGVIYAYALNSNGTFAKVATIVTGFPAGVMDLHFDRDRGDFWAVCDNTCGGRSELLTINPSTGRFGIAHLYERPSGMPNINNEGFTTAPDFECVSGLKPAFWSDDNDTGGNALRAGTVPCSFVATTHVLTVAKNGTGAGTVTSSPAGIDCGSDCSEPFVVGTNVTLTATAAPGSVFAGWFTSQNTPLGTCGTNATCVVTVDAAKTVYAKFNTGAYTLTVTVVKAAGAAGTVASTPAGISNCGGTTSPDCSQGYPGGTVVTLTATPGANSAFSGWTGAGCTGTGTCVVTMDAAKDVTATFAASAYVLTAAKNGTGTGTVTSAPAGIDCGADCSEPYPAATDVTLTATVGAGSVFAGWFDSTGTALSCGTTATCVVTVDAAKTVYAKFNAGAYTLTVSVVKNGGAAGTVASSPAGISDCGGTAPDCSQGYAGGTVVTLTATAGATSTFTGWSGGGCTGTGTCVVTMDASKTVTATFTRTTLTVGRNGTGAGTVTSSPSGITCGADCTEEYAPGTDVTLTATPAAGSVFAGWFTSQNTPLGTCGTNASCVVTVDVSKTVYAKFNLGAYTLTVTRAGAGSGTVTSSPAGIACGGANPDCSQGYSGTTQVTLTAAPNPGSAFTGWSGAGCSGTGTCVVTMDASKSVTATFALTP